MKYLIRINFVRKIFVRNFRVTIFLLISMCTIILIILVKKFASKIFIILCKMKILNNEIFVNYSTIKWHFYVRDQFMQTCQNWPLDYAIFYFCILELYAM